MNKKATIVLLSSTVFTLFLGCISSVFAWIIPNERFNVDDARGYTTSAYFGGGDGSEETPYIISDPIHLYNLAWLQYLGEFNKSEPGPMIQYHFEVTKDLDMSGFYLPPIGTELYPFFHEFNGGGHVVSNLNVTNHIGEGYITKHPMKVEQVENADIVGFFGVIGDYKSHTASSFVPSVYNFKLSNTNVVAYNNQALVGIAAGYINGDVSSVGVVDSDIGFANTSVRYLDSSITQNLSDYTLVGYCTPEYRNQVTVTDTDVYMPTVQHYEVEHEESGGDADGSGGSIPMTEIYNRVKNIYSNYARTNRSIVFGIDEYVRDGVSSFGNETTVTGRLYTPSSPNNYNEKYGSYNFGGTGTTYLYLTGGVVVDQYDTENDVIANGYIVKGGNYYLNANANFNGLTTTTIEATAHPWRLDNNNRLYITHNNLNYYVVYNNNNVSLSTSTTNAFVRNGNYFSVSITTGNGTNTYYLRITTNTNPTTVATTTYTNYRTSFDLISVTNRGIFENKSKTYVDYDYNANNTYIPLSVNDPEDDYSASENNVGYILSGINTSGRTKIPNDIRISQYKTSDLSASYSDGAFTNIYTVNSTGRHNISTDVDDNDGFERFAYVKGKLLNTLAQTSPYIHGLHFMDAAIDSKGIVTTQYARINGTEYHNYEMLANSIDFQLREKSIVNFMGGSYYNNSNGVNYSFMSLHEVFRDNNNKITDEKEISKIYSDGNELHSVVYQYSDGFYSIGYAMDKDGNRLNDLSGSTISSLPSGYSAVFDTAWIKYRADMVMNAAYYFEFPMNKGEYAFGCVPGVNGAYLMYLDIAANKKQIIGTEVAEKVVYTVKSYVTPFGVALLTSTTDVVDNYDSVIALAIKSYVDTIGLILNNDVNDTKQVTVDVNNLNAIEVTYNTSKSSVVDKNNNAINVVPTNTTVDTRIRRTFYEPFDDAYVVTIIENGVRTIKKYDSEGMEVTMSSDDISFYNNLDFDTELVAGTDLLYSFFYQYVGETTVQLTWNCNVTYSADEDVDSVFNSYTFTFDVEYSDGELPNLYVVVTKVNDTYVLTINDHECTTLFETIIPIENAA